MLLNRQIRNNFFKVCIAALTESRQLIILTTSLFIALAFAQYATWILSLALSAILVRAVLMLFDDDFVQKVLTKSNQKQFSFLPGLIERTDQRLKEARFFSEVEQDLKKAKIILTKINQTWSSLSKEQIIKHTPIVRDLLSRLTERLIELSYQEQSVLKFLNQNDRQQLQNDRELLNQQLQNTDDQIVRQEYIKALALAETKQKSLSRVSDRLKRINSYNSRILAEMENTQIFLARLSITPRGLNDYDQTYYLTADIRQLATDLDKIEDESIEVSKEVRRYLEEVAIDQELKN